MIVWVASFPRSGNTFLRIVLRRRYGVPTSVIYDVDGVAERLGPAFVGFAERHGTLEAMRASPHPYFVKTHRQRDDRVDDIDGAICLVRDGRDALVSWARQASEAEPDRYEAELRAMLTRRDVVGTGSWGRNVLSWLTPPAPGRVVLRYDDLTSDPAAAVDRTMAVVAPGLRPVADGIPTFEELRRVDDRFFRRGLTGSHRDELPEPLHALFWAQPDNVAAMELLGLGRERRTGTP